ncbi:hypothetical protein [Paenibacillus sp. GYB003]|uniref:hypothetical protein n=1 Tax=Paenibacillus sp. GYB003 TaxID=2994392 RepID=UPI002F96C5D9
MNTKSKKRIPRNVRLSELTENNRKWFLEFERWLINHEKGYSKGSIDQMSNVALNFLHACEDKDVNLLGIDEIRPFFETERASTGNTRINHIINLYTFLSEKKLSTPFEVTELNQYLVDSKALKKDSEEGAAKALTIEEIILIRSFLKNDFKRLLTFELVYQYGLELEELAQCNEESYDFQTHSFSIKDKDNRVVPIYVNERIHGMIMKQPGIIKEVKKYSYQERLKDIGKKLEEVGLMDRPIRWMDIDKTRQTNFFRCPSCHRLYENTPDNWALIQYETDELNTKWIVCRSVCAKKGIRHE